jgi:hypothetical protein
MITEGQGKWKGFLFTEKSISLSIPTCHHQKVAGKES